MPADNPDWLRDVQTIADDLTPVLSSTPTGTFDIIVTPGKSYQSLLLVANSPSATDHSTIQLRVKDPNGNGMLFASYTTTFGIGTTFYPLPVPIVANGNVDVTVIQNSGTIVPADFRLYGLNAPFGGTQLRRWDGYNYPVGNTAFNVNNTGSGTLIAAPGVGERILLYTLDVVVVAGAGSATYAVVTGVRGGITYNPMIVAAAANGANGKSNVYHAGLLLDYNTALTFGNSISVPGAATYNGTYDLVS